MKRLAVLCALALGLAIAADVRADGLCPGCGAHPAFGGHQPLSVGNHQPWWNMIAARDKCRGRDQARQQKFWHDYYRSMSAYYGMLEHMDWVSYYKHHGTPIGFVPGRSGGASSVQVAPMFMPAPSIPWGMTQNLNAPWSPPNVPWGYSPSCSPDVPCATCH
jgi:hypothetical protein